MFYIKEIYGFADLHSNNEGRSQLSMDVINPHIVGF